MLENLEALTKNGWEKSNDGLAIKKSFVFPNFIEALGWMVKAGVWAEKYNHHPNWENVYSNLNIKFSTHDLGGISNLDQTLATEINNLLK